MRQAKRVEHLRESERVLCLRQGLRPVAEELASGHEPLQQLRPVLEAGAVDEPNGRIGLCRRKPRGRRQQSVGVKSAPGAARHALVRGRKLVEIEVSEKIEDGASVSAAPRGSGERASRGSDDQEAAVAT